MDNTLVTDEEFGIEVDFYEENDSDSESDSTNESNHEYDDEDGNDNNFGL